MSSDFVWTEKYRPKTIEECILPESIKKTFKDFLDKGEVPNLLLSGPPGCGKTLVGKATAYGLTERLKEESNIDIEGCFLHIKGKTLFANS